MSLVLVVVLLAAAAAATLTIDLGPSLRDLAVREGSRFLKRPIHIAALQLRVLRGRVELDDFSIEGRDPEDRPFFVARKLSLSLDWSGAAIRPAQCGASQVARQVIRYLRSSSRPAAECSMRPDFIITSVELIDWQMLVEKFSDGDSFLRLPFNETTPEGPRRFTTTLRYFRGSNGRFTYEDHEAPWSVVAPNIDLSITNLPQYHGRFDFSDGVISIQRYVPMSAAMKAEFTIDGRLIHLDKIDIKTDGARTTGTGTVDFAHWPEQTYEVKSRVQFSRMRELFFGDESWRVSGDGDFGGTFHLFKGGYDLVGRFGSPLAGLNTYRFPALYGSLHWTRGLFEVTQAGSGLYGGTAQYAFSIERRDEDAASVARFDAMYTDVDVAQISDFYELPGLRPGGAASGHNLLEWPLGRFKERTGEGHVIVVPPAGVEPMSSSLDAPRGEEDDRSLPEWGPFGPLPLPSHLPVSAQMAYRFDPDAVEIGPSRFATERSHVTFSGKTAWGEQSTFRFHVTSGDWQESDQLLAGMLTDFGAAKKPVTFGGRGEFDGVMTGTFREPRIEGTFSGEELRAWDTRWGSGAATVVVENNYVTIADGVIRDAGSEIRAEGVFSLGYPRDDGGEELNARFRVTGRDLDGLRHAFKLDDWPVSGALTGEFHLTGEYERPIGFGAMTLDAAVAYGEPFQKATASLRFDGSGVRLDGVNISKATGTISGAAFVGWDGTYSFEADGRRIPVQRLATLEYPRAQPAGQASFSAAGSSTFENPRYDVRFRIDDLFVAEEPVGLVTGTLAMRGREINGEIDVSSPRLAITGTGRVALRPKLDAELTFRFHDSSLDPYIRLFVPKLSPYTTAVASGSIHVAGDPSDIDRLLVDGTVDRLEMRIFDYALKNGRPIRLALDQHVVRVQDLQVVGEGTQLTVGGSIRLHDERIALQASGDANLGILQGFFHNVRGSGRAVLRAAVDGPLFEPVFSGSATITDGRLRHFSLPNSLEAVNGTIRFDSRGIQLDDITASMGGGRVVFGGRVGLDGYLPGELNVTARGEDMNLRYPEGVRSTVDANLTVRGNVKAPTLAGSILVKNALWSRRIDPTGGILDFGGLKAPVPGEVGSSGTTPVPVRFDIEVRIPATLRVENNLARLVASANLQLRGTYDRPQLFGRAEVDRGEVSFEGRRYLVTRGNIDFTNPAKIEPFFDVEAETRVRVPGLVYQVTVRAVGTPERLQPELSSDPPLPTADVLSLLLSDVRRSGASDAELRAKLDPNEPQRNILTARATQLLANPVSAEFNRVAQQTFGVDSFQVTPSLIDTQSTNRLNPSARVTIGKRISDRVYLTFSRSLSTAYSDQILLLEFDESNRLSWILSRNEDSTYALEVRVRHIF
ncbi:MAG: hypothetical protein DMF89_05765 [Acidobacteria bacterium]|nr:MAG: hypothetical protein DMF89_05765 [Acidobacteriota bacterium]